MLRTIVAITLFMTLGACAESRSPGRASPSGPPSIELLTPPEDLAIPEGALMVVTARVAGFEKPPRVQISVDDASVGERTSPPYEFSVRIPGAHDITVTARASGHDGQTAVASRTIRVFRIMPEELDADSAQAWLGPSAFPVVELTKPLSGEIFTAPVAITVEATVSVRTNAPSAKPATLESVLILLDGREAHTFHAPPYSTRLLIEAAGDHRIEVVATDSAHHVRRAAAAVRVTNRTH